MSSRKHERSNVQEEHLPPAKRESRTGTKRSHRDPHAAEDDDEVEKDSEMELELSQLPSQDIEEGTLSFVSLCCSIFGPRTLSFCIVNVCTPSYTERGGDWCAGQGGAV